MALLRVEEGDISTFQGDAVVNAANNHLRLGTGVAGAILRRGGWTIQEECDRHVREHGPIRVGEAAITGAGDLACRFVIHAAALGDEPATAASIRSATRSSLQLALTHDIASLAFPVLGSGIGGFCFDESARIMVEEIRGVDAEHSSRLDSAVIYGYLPEQAEALRRILG